jgi:hypothetical protein
LYEGDTLIPKGTSGTVVDIIGEAMAGLYTVEFFDEQHKTIGVISIAVAPYKNIEDWIKQLPS